MLLDGEMGLTLPDKMDTIPQLFFDAIGIIRSNKHQATKEDKK